MNIIIDSKYASVYAAVHSSVWEAVGRRRPGSDVSVELLILQVVRVCYQPPAAVCSRKHLTRSACFILMLSELCLTALGLFDTGQRGKKIYSWWLKFTVYIYCYLFTPVPCWSYQQSWLLTACAVRFFFKSIHQAKTDLETKAYIVAYILPYSALFDILHL